MKLRWLRSSVVVLLCGVLPAQAPSAAVLGRDDVQFALHLARSGHPDLADGVCRAILHFGNCEAAVVGHAARQRALADVDREAIRGAVAASPRHAGPRGTSLRPLGLVLYEAGRKLLGVPDELRAFLDWDGDPARAAELWSDAATLLQAARELGDPDDVALPLARLYRLFGHAVEAAARYEELFTRDALIDKATQRIDRQVVAARPELLQAYLEWGVVQRRLVAADEGDGKRFAPCLKVFDNLLLAAEDKSPVRWLAVRECIAVSVDRGETEQARKELDARERELAPAAFKQYGFDALRDRLR